MYTITMGKQGEHKYVGQGDTLAEALGHLMVSMRESGSPLNPRLLVDYKEVLLKGVTSFIILGA